MTDREREVDELYEHLAESWLPQAGPVPLDECDPPPEAGVYVFFEQGEVRRSGGPRIVRVGKAGYAKLDINLRSRLLRMHLHGTHRDEQYDDQGRLISSVFRKHVGRALISRDGLTCRTWGSPSVPEDSRLRRAEAEIEETVTSELRGMLVAWYPIRHPGERKKCEEAMITLLSNYGREAVDPPSTSWLGQHHNRDEIRRSGLWSIECAVPSNSYRVSARTMRRV